MTLISAEPVTAAVPVPKERLGEVVGAFGGPEALERQRRAFRANMEFFEGRREELRRRYPDEWVAIADRRAAAHSPDAPEAVRMLREAGCSPRGAALRFVAAEDRGWLL